MHLLTDILRFMTIGCLLLIVVQVWRSNTPRKQSIPAIGFCTGVMCYLLADWEPTQHYYIFFIILLPTLVTPVFFWLLSKSLFDDNFYFSKWVSWLVGAILLISYCSFAINWLDILQTSNSTKIIFSMIQQAISLLFVIMAIVEATRNRESDLVISRLKFRSAFIISSAVLITLTILSEIAFRGGEAPAWMEFSQKIVIAALTFYFAIRRLEFKSGFFDEIKETEKTINKKEVDHQLAQQLISLIEGEKYYRTEGLTIRQLADKMQVKEYKLRQTINQHLGFRNFNDFLNSYRIQESCDLLIDTRRKEAAILEIAFEMGYNSLAPFNKAFKETTGMTPTEWRKSKLNL